MRFGLIGTGALVALAATLAACGSGDKGATTASGDPNAAANVEVAGNAATRVSTAQGTAAKGAVSLMPDGLMVSGKAQGSRVALARFGDPQDKVIASLAGSLGTPRESDNAECGAGKMHFADFGGLKANFASGRFVGWMAESGKGLKVGEEISPDWPYAKLEKIGASKVAGSTLEGEFKIDNRNGQRIMGGFVDKSNKVVSLHAGTNCFFR